MKKFIFFLLIISVMLPSCSKADNNYIHPSFSITAEELDNTLSSLPEEIKTSIISDRHGFIKSIQPLISIHSDLLILADKNHPLSDIDIPQDLVDLDNYNIKVNKKNMQLRKSSFDALYNMKNDMEKENLEVLVSSAYRSFKYQEKIYNYYISIYGQEETDKFSARPGTSQHQLGTAVDFGSITEEYADTEEGRWMFANAYKYGFSLSYPKGYETLTGYNYEPWHYRYITKEGCLLQKNYFSDIQQIMLEYLDDNISFFKEKIISPE